jgi:WhiB family redox-sensing transcriptional regulator
VSHWAEAAACKGLTALMFPARGDTDGAEQARRVCASCPVFDECLDYVTRNPERHGVWAGMAGKEITEERKRRNLISNQSKHGYRSKYVAGCRCDLCRSANAAYLRKNRGNFAAL